LLTTQQSAPGTMQHFTKILCGFDDELRDDMLKSQPSQRRRMGKKERGMADEKAKRVLTPKTFVPYTGPFVM
jgi:hypothetical protein